MILFGDLNNVVTDFAGKNKSRASHRTHSEASPSVVAPGDVKTQRECEPGQHSSRHHGPQ